ncbi:MAG: hypothetical protein H6623_08360 [Bdellovibrionaceae bacterium]|nr:hypothetical protein [Pseudobdellovibrionaceae bacterium]
MKKQLFVLFSGFIFLMGCKSNMTKDSTDGGGSDISNYETITYTNEQEESNKEMILYIYSEFSFQGVSIQDSESATGRRVKYFFQNELNDVLEEIVQANKTCLHGPIPINPVYGLTYIWVHLKNGDNCLLEQPSTLLFQKLAELASEVHETGEDEPIATVQGD